MNEVKPGYYIGLTKDSNIGFFEWYSNNYVLEDLAPLAQLIDYAEDNEIRNMATDRFQSPVI